MFNVPSVRGELINEQILQNNQAKIDKLSDQLRETYSQVYPDGFGELKKKVARLNDIFRKGDDSVIQERSDELMKYYKDTETKIDHTKMASLYEEINKSLAEKEKKVEKLKALTDKFRQIDSMGKDGGKVDQLTARMKVGRSNPDYLD